MIIENRKQAFKIRVWQFLIPFIFSMIIVVILMSNWFHRSLFGLSKEILALILLGLFIIYAVIHYLMDYNYIYFNDNDHGKIVFRHISLRLFSTRKLSIEIPKETFQGFELKKKMMGWKEMLVLFQNTKKGIARFPEVCINSLSKKQRCELITLLGQAKK
jgi:hypothetical protein